MSKELEFLGKLKKLCESYHFWIVFHCDSDGLCYLLLSDSKDDSVFLDEMIDFYDSDLPF